MGMWPFRPLELTRVRPPQVTPSISLDDPSARFRLLPSRGMMFVAQIDSKSRHRDPKPHTVKVTRLLRGLSVRPGS